MLSLLQEVWATPGQKLVIIVGDGGRTAVVICPTLWRKIVTLESVRCSIGNTGIVKPYGFGGLGLCRVLSLLSTSVSFIRSCV